MNNALVEKRKWAVVDPVLLYVVIKIPLYKLLFEFFFLDVFYYTSNYNTEYKDAG